MKKIVNKLKCFFDGLPCERDGYCEISMFVGMDDEVLWRCPRFVVKVRKK